LLAGGHQERERHPGTENVPAIVGFGVAAAVCARALPAETARLGALRDALERGLGGIAGVRFHGTRAPEARSPATVSVAFAGAPAQLVVIALDLEGICVSTGAACTSGSPQPSPVLRALGLSEAEAREGVRISLGWTSTEADIEGLLRVVPEVVARVRAAARVSSPVDLHAALDRHAALARHAGLARRGDA
jgi:cysteine desulfurase